MGAWLVRGQLRQAHGRVWPCYWNGADWKTKLTNAGHFDTEAEARWSAENRGKRWDALRGAMVNTGFDTWGGALVTNIEAIPAPEQGEAG